MCSGFLVSSRFGEHWQRARLDRMMLEGQMKKNELECRDNTEARAVVTEDRLEAKNTIMVETGNHFFQSN